MLWKNLNMYRFVVVLFCLGWMVSCGGKVKKETEVIKAKVNSFEVIKNDIIVLNVNAGTVRFYDDNKQIVKKIALEDLNPYRQIDFKQKEIKSIRQRDCYLLSEINKTLKKSLFGKTTNTSVHKDTEAYMFCVAYTLTNTSRHNLAVSYVLELKSKESSEIGHSIGLGGITHVDIYNKLGEIIQSFDFENLRVQGIVLSDDGRYLALEEGLDISPDQDFPNKKYHFYDVETKERLYYYDCHKKQCGSLDKWNLNRIRFQIEKNNDLYNLNFIDLSDRIHYYTDVYSDSDTKIEFYKDYYVKTNKVAVNNKINKDTVRYKTIKIKQ